MKMFYNEQEDAIYIGKWKTDTFVQYKTRAYWEKSVLSANNIPITVLHPKERNKVVQEALQCSSPVLYKMFNKMQYKHFVVPYKDFLMKLAYKPGRIDIHALSLIKKHEGILNQSKKDGLWNIMPLIMKTGKTPQEMKKEYGNKWKVLANNSLHKNKVVASYPCDGDFAGIAHVPTSLLTSTNTGSSTLSMLNFYTSNCKGYWGNDKKIREVSLLLRDTDLLLGQINKMLNFKWSLRRVKEEHDKAVAEINARKFSPEIFESVKEIPVKEFQYSGYTAALLQSPLDIANEGAAMGHCVAGYSNNVRDGEYLVYSITKDGERSSTLGINVMIQRERKGAYTHPTGKDTFVKDFSISQHYGKYNRKVVDLDEQLVVEYLIEKLNEVKN